MSKIEWTEKTWNPTTGCDRVSSGCDNCYALTQSRRLKAIGAAKYQNDGNRITSGPGFGLTMHPDTLTAPLSWRKPRRVFVNSMSDLFHDGVTDEFLARVWAVMAATPQHTYQVLTKRHGRMRSLLQTGEFFELVVEEAVEALGLPGIPWPLPNVWVGVSVEDQKRADLRIPALLDTPAAVRFLSCEPLLGPVDLTDWMPPGRAPNGQPIDWVIVGGESGHGARPMGLTWVRALTDQCRQAGVPVFVKQLGSRWAEASGWGGKGGLPEQWDVDLRIREFPTVAVPTW